MLTWFRILEKAKALLKEQKGQALGEYALIIALVALLTVASLRGMKDAIVNVLETIANYLGG